MSAQAQPLAHPPIDVYKKNPAHGIFTGVISPCVCARSCLLLVTKIGILCSETFHFLLEMTQLAVDRVMVEVVASTIEMASGNG